MLRASRPRVIFTQAYRVMCVTLEAIHLNHDPTSKTTGAFSIRRNERCDIVLPEWRRDLSLRPEDAPAAYSYKAVEKLKEITIKAEFSCDAADPPTLVRALDGHGHRGNVLGTAVAREVKFERGKCVATLVLSDVRILELGVGVNEVIWNWQYSEDGKNWVDFATSLHRIYTVVDMPHDPWQPVSRDITDTQLPWTEVLDFACRAAAATTCEADAATKITQWTNSLGPEFIHYDNDLSGWTVFSDDPPPRFDCTQFLLLLTAGKNLVGRQVNCDDCAAIVVSFATILGCRLSEGRMVSGETFGLNPNIKIGKTKVARGRFSYHMVAWLGKALPNDRLFDACLRLELDSDGTPPPLFTVPANIVFTEYRPRLTPAASVRPTGAQPVRKIGVGARHVPPDTFVGWAALLAAAKSADLDLIDFRVIDITLAQHYLQSFWQRRGNADAAVAINMYQVASGKSTKPLLENILGRFHLRPERLEPGLGSEAYASEMRFTVVFVRDPFVFLLRNTGTQVVSNEGLARVIDQLVAN